MNIIPIKIIPSWYVSLIVNNNKNMADFCIRGRKRVAIHFKVYKCSMEKVTALENYVTSIKAILGNKITRLCKKYLDVVTISNKSLVPAT
jgi:ribosomal protein L1